MGGGAKDLVVRKNGLSYLRKIAGPGGPERSQAGQDQRESGRTRGARQDRTGGRAGGLVAPGRTGPVGAGGLVVPGRARPEGMEGGSVGTKRASAVGGCPPEGARGTGQSSNAEVPVVDANAAVPGPDSQ